ncbi:MAG: ABC transporter ATP-binding protein [Ignavibacteriae bacterium HGW-Ignavibacteriae-4]|jgi:phospholipid/cholesterol/gamma-HCH transport system ATP-binding protein|nr:MAG: ABC transporter ATP-binding protein [Ignavibacteriae bacterium HGW-Ignavibacteriae-4]
MISIKNLYKSFGDKHVLNGINIDVENGSTHCIIGKSGSGKSVLLKHIVGLLKPDKGEIFVDDKEIETLSYKELFEIRKSMGFVFQGAALFDSYNVYENIIIGLYEHGERDTKILDETAIKVLSSVGLLPPIKERESANFIKEWEILKTKKPSDLSGGMRKRVGVARALVGDPKYIFYDEPTTGLDPVTSEQIDELVKEIGKSTGVTSIVITHDMFSVFRVADQVSMLHDGLVRFEGNVQQLKDSKDEVVSEFIDRFRLEGEFDS